MPRLTRIIIFYRLMCYCVYFRIKTWIILVTFIDFHQEQNIWIDPYCEALMARAACSAGGRVRGPNSSLTVV